MRATPLDYVSALAPCLVAPDTAMPPMLTSHASRHPVRRLDVYRNNVVASLIDVLAAYFPVVERLVGTEFFRAMAREFVVGAPPRSPILSRYGADFPAFLVAFEPVADLPYLPDVARLEWLRQRAYHAADRTPLTGADLAGIDPACAGRLVLELHPSLDLMGSPYPIVAIWQTNTYDDEVRSIDFTHGGECALVVRPHLYVVVRAIPAAAHHFIAHLKAGLGLERAARRSLETAPDFDVQTAIAMVIASGAVVGCRLADTQND